MTTTIQFTGQSLVVLAAASVSACGGGGSGPAPVMNAPSAPMVAGYDLSLGTPSTEEAARKALFGGVFEGLPYYSPDEEKFADVSAANQELNSEIEYLPVAAYDTRADKAWELGWTGKGVKVGILDYFNSNNTIDSHGDWVSVVIHSVAPEAELGFERLDEYPRRSAIFNQYEAGRKFEESGFDIINNSWGIFRFTRDSDGNVTPSELEDFDQLASDFAEQLIQESLTDDDADDDRENVLWIYAAGNSGRVCKPRTVDYCNFFGAVEIELNERDYTGVNQLIWVGALEDEDSEELAEYSLEAGQLASSFIVAHDDVLAIGDAAGTSFAAPRVSGAAALLRHKFPNLNGADLKQVLLQTAEDLGPEGVDRKFGHGRLDLLNALSPQGSLRPK